MGGAGVVLRFDLPAFTWWMGAGVAGAVVLVLLGEGWVLGVGRGGVGFVSSWWCFRCYKMFLFLYLVRPSRVYRCTVVFASHITLSSYRWSWNLRGGKKNSSSQDALRLTIVGWSRV